MLSIHDTNNQILWFKAKLGQNASLNTITLKPVRENWFIAPANQWDSVFSILIGIKAYTTPFVWIKLTFGITIVLRLRAKKFHVDWIILTKASSRTGYVKQKANFNCSPVPRWNYIRLSSLICGKNAIGFAWLVWIGYLIMGTWTYHSINWPTDW